MIRVLNHTLLQPRQRVCIRGRWGRYIGTSEMSSAIIEMEDRAPFFTFLGWRSGGLVPVAPFENMMVAA